MLDILGLVARRIFTVAFIAPAGGSNTARQSLTNNLSKENTKKRTAPRNQIGPKIIIVYITHNFLEVKLTNNPICI